MTDTPNLPDDWSEAIAEVTDCHYDTRAGSALAFGISSRRHFRIAYHYRVGDQLHTGQCFSAVARPQGSLFRIRYHPGSPHLSHAGRPSPPALPLPALAIGASLLVALAFLLLLHGC